MRNLLLSNHFQLMDRSHLGCELVRSEFVGIRHTERIGGIVLDVDLLVKRTGLLDRNVLRE